MTIFSYPFMINAFIAAGMAAIMTPLVGSVVVLKRLAPVGDALSHAALAGVAVGLCLGEKPVYAAIAVSVAMALVMEFLRRVFPHYAELSTSVISAFSVGLAAVLSGFVKSPAGFSAFLFGSVVMIPKAELIVEACLFIVVVGFCLIMREPLFYICFDEEGARAAGVKVGAINAAFTVLTAATASIASRAVGALIVSSLMTIPPACAMLTSKSYKSNMVLSVAFGLAFSFIGIFAAFYADLKPGGAIALAAVAGLLVIIAARGAVFAARRRRQNGRRKGG